MGSQQIKFNVHIEQRQRSPPANEFCEGCVLHLSVILFTGGCLPQCMLGYTTPPDQRQTIRRTRDRHPPRTRGRHPAGSIPPSQCMLGDTANKRAVRILLECILISAWTFLQYTDRCSQCETDSDWSGETEPEVKHGGATWRLYNPGTWSARGVIVFVTFCWSLILLNVLLTVVLMVDDNTGSCSG